MNWYDDLILMYDDLSESSLAYAVPLDSYTNREGQGGEPPAKCIMIPVVGECKN